MFTKRVAAMWAVWLIMVLTVWVGTSSLAVQYEHVWYWASLFTLNVVVWLWWWLDAGNEGHPRPIAMGIAVLAWPVFAVPFYLLKYKGWKRSLLSLLKFLGFLIVFLVYLSGVVLLRAGGS